MREWNGLRVRRESAEERHPQDLVKGVGDDQTVPFARPDGDTGYITVASAVLNGDDSVSKNFAGYTSVQRIEAAQLAAVGGSSIRITFQSNGIASMASAYVGHAAAAGDGYDFASTPTQLNFGSGTATGPWVGDIYGTANFTIESGKALLISSYQSGTSITGAGIDFLGADTLTGWTNYNGFGDSASTVNKTGFTIDGAVSAISLVEIFRASGTTILNPGDVTAADL